MSPPRWQIGFNYSMVRLKRDFSLAAGSRGIEFQFHNGSIKAYLSCPYPFSQTIVSIPQWFD